MVAAHCMAVWDLVVAGCLRRRVCRHDEFFFLSGNTHQIEFGMKKKAPSAFEYPIQVRAVPVRICHWAQGITGESHRLRDCTSELMNFRKIEINVFKRSYY